MTRGTQRYTDVINLPRPLYTQVLGGVEKRRLGGERKPSTKTSVPTVNYSPYSFNIQLEVFTR